MLAVWLVEPLESAAESTTVADPMAATGMTGVVGAERPLPHPERPPAAQRAATPSTKAIQRLRRRIGTQPNSSSEAAAMPAAPTDRLLARTDEEGCDAVLTSKATELVWPAVKESEEGENVQVTLAGRAPQLNETRPLNATLAASVRVAVPL